jgi:hypothetical protein
VAIGPYQIMHKMSSRKRKGHTTYYRKSIGPTIQRLRGERAREKHI